MECTTYRYRFGTAEFDESRFELKVAGLPVEVERRAMDLLVYLLRHAGELVSKEELLREVWAGRVTVEKVLPNAVAKLRRALGEENAALIVTQARVGYRLEGPVTRTAVERHAGQAVELVVGAAVPGRASYLLCRPLGAHRGSEVWLAEHAKTRDRRVFKFALDDQRLRSLQRETTLLRVLHDGLQDSRRFVGLVDWNFASAPYFVECEYAGDDLLRWSGSALAGLDTQARIELFLQIVDAIADAHSLGVLHKDIKPANVLIEEGPAGRQVRITDFGSARMLDPERLALLGITRQGLTVTEDVAGDAYSGTPLYLAPEVFAGQSPTVRSDVYALGVLLYQLLAGRLREPMASGWEAHIDDPLLREDIRLATDGDPERRLGSAAALAERLRSLDLRRAEAGLRAAAEAESARASAALARSRARRPFVAALLLSMAVGLVVAITLQHSAHRARTEAEAELAKATAMLQFLEEDLINRANPLILGKGAQAPISDVLLASRDRLALRFAGQPLIEASLRLSLSGLFNTLDLWAEGEVEAAQALKTFERELGPDSAEARRARAIHAKVLSRLSRFEEAAEDLARLSTSGPMADTLTDRYQRALATSTFLLAQGRFADAAPELRKAIAAHDRLRTAGGTHRDQLVLDLIFTLGISSETAEALSTYESFVGELAARPGDTRILRALAQQAVARSLSLRGEHARAEALLLEAREVVAGQLGEDHTRHLSLLSELLGVYFRQADWDRALPIARDVHRRFRAKLGDEHNSTWASLGNLGRTLYEAGHSAEASEVLREAHQRLVASVGEDNPQAQDVAYALVCAELSLGRTSMRGLLERLDPVQLEKGRSTGRWAGTLQVLRGVQAHLDGDATTARALIEAGLAIHADDPARRYNRLLREAELLLRPARTAGR